jgi:hypothetical protein
MRRKKLKLLLHTPVLRENPFVLISYANVCDDEYYKMYECDDELYSKKVFPSLSSFFHTQLGGIFFN